MIKMNKRKIGILIILFVSVCFLAISFVSAVKYTGPCHTLWEKHDTVWEKKSTGTQYDKIVEKNGKFYKRYLNFVSRSVVGCKHKSHLENNPADYPYKYQTYGVDPDKPYIYKIAKQKTTGKIFFNPSTKPYDHTYVKLGKGENIAIHYSWIDRQYYKNLMIITTWPKKITAKDDLAKYHRLVKASVTFTKNSNGKILASTKTFTPSKVWGDISYRPKNGYIPRFARVTYVY